MTPENFVLHLYLAEAWLTEAEDELESPETRIKVARAHIKEALDALDSEVACSDSARLN